MHHAFGGNAQVVFDPIGFPLWVSDVRPGLTHDLTAARELVLPTLYPHAARGLPGLADKSYTGAGVGIHVPLKRSPEGPLHINNRCYNQLITALRAPTERGNHPARPLARPRPGHRVPAAHRRNRRGGTRVDLTRPPMTVRRPR